MKKFYLLTFLIFGLTTQAQLVIDNTTQTSALLVQNVPVGNGVILTNIKFNDLAANVKVALGSNNSTSASLAIATPVQTDANLTLLSGQIIRNVAGLEFDFVFASEEYPEFVNNINV